MDQETFQLERIERTLEKVRRRLSSAYFELTGTLGTRTINNNQASWIEWLFAVDREIKDALVGRSINYNSLGIGTVRMVRSFELKMELLRDVLFKARTVYLYYIRNPAMPFLM